MRPLPGGRPSTQTGFPLLWRRGCLTTTLNGVAAVAAPHMGAGAPEAVMPRLPGPVAQGRSAREDLSERAAQMKWILLTAAQGSS